MDVLRLAGRVAVGVRAAPGARPHHLRAELLVAVVDRRALCRLVRASGQEAELDRLPRRARGRRPDRRLVGLVLARVQADGGDVAELALAGAHRHRRVALGQLDRVEALGDGALDVLVGHVLADADEALALLRGAVERRRRNGGCRRPRLPQHRRPRCRREVGSARRCRARGRTRPSRPRARAARTRAGGRRT